MMKLEVRQIASKQSTSDEGYFFEADIQQPKNVDNLHNDLLFLSQRIKIEKVEKLLANLHYQKE